MVMEQPVERNTVSCIFDYEDADIILLSRDPPTEFHVHSTILSASSPFFSDMFTLPQPPSPPSESISPKRTIPIIPVTESQQALSTLLQFIYPIPKPQLTLPQLPPLLDASIKYDLTFVLQTLRQLLVSPINLKKSPIQVYAISCRFGFIEEARLASTHTLHFNLLDFEFDSPSNKRESESYRGTEVTDTESVSIERVTKRNAEAEAEEAEREHYEDLKYISAYQYHRLLSLHRTRSKQSQQIINFLNCPIEIKCMSCNSSLHTSQGQPAWYYKWESEAKAELAIRPVSDVIFSMEFISKAVEKSGCTRCSGSVLDCWRWIMEMKEKIDALPRTI